MALLTIKYTRGKLLVLDQLQLPSKTEYINVTSCQDGWDVIKNMKVRGAPAIAIVGCLSLAVEVTNKEWESKGQLSHFICDRLQYLNTARPTAVNMADAVNKLTRYTKNIASDLEVTVEELEKKFVCECEQMLEKDLAVNKSIGKHGAEHILNKYANESVKILTHCNTGSLATAGYGTALGVVRALHERDKIAQVYCTETRPYNQGARLTAYELVHENIPATLICDSKAAILMDHHDISAVVVGADRVVANGDTANKVGTYQLAIVAKHHNVPFYVACPSTTFDAKLCHGKEIVIEERPHHEMTTIEGIRVAAEGINCWNPAFDITPATLITGGIITEFGVFQPSEVKNRLAECLKHDAQTVL